MSEEQSRPNFPCDHEFALMHTRPNETGKLEDIKEYLINMNSAQETIIAKNVLAVIQAPFAYPYVVSQDFQDIPIQGSVAGLSVRRYQYEVENCDWLPLVTMRRNHKRVSLQQFSHNGGWLVIEFKDKLMRNDKRYSRLAGVSASSTLIPKTNEETHFYLQTKQLDLDSEPDNTEAAE
ncbi:MAG: hypothetical protein LBL18_00820 [Bacteroidales bacterium]|jgi:hypothetical protein|nr:hypothetical protein [Bacteroidales bacterium]